MEEQVENQARRRALIVALAINTSIHLFKSVMENDHDDVRQWLDRAYIFTLERRFRGKRLKPTRNEGFLDVTIPNMMSVQFRQHFRMKPEVFECLENRIGPLLNKQNNVGRPVIPVRTQLLVTLWLLATPDCYRVENSTSVGDLFGVRKSSASDSFFRVVKCLCSISAEVIKWPSHAQITEGKRKFHTWGGMPNVIGAIDGTDIEIKAPKVEPQANTNRKKRTAMILQAVCDSDRRFIDCFTGYPGSVGDVRVLRNSDLYAAVWHNLQMFFPNEEYIIGDKIYLVHTWLIPAIKDHGAITVAQKNFNRVHAATRQVIERAFALLKGRWRRLKYLDMSRVDMIAYVIMACWVLHNICLDHLMDFIEDNDENYNDFIQEGLPDVNMRAGNLDQIEDRNAAHDADGQAKRNY